MMGGDLVFDWSEVYVQLGLSKMSWHWQRHGKQIEYNNAVRYCSIVSIKNGLSIPLLIYARESPQ